MAYIAQYKLWKWYDTICIVWEQLWILSLSVPKVEWFALYHTNPSHKVLLSFVWLMFSSFGWDMDMRRIRSDKNLSLGMPKAPRRKYSRKIQATKLGDAPEGIPSFVSNIIGNLTWSDVYICHMICVLLGASFYFVSIFLMLFRIMFFIFYFNKSGNDSLCHAYFASILVVVWKQKVYRCCKNSLEKSECDTMLKLFCKMSSDKFSTVW